MLVKHSSRPGFVTQTVFVSAVLMCASRLCSVLNIHPDHFCMSGLFCENELIITARAARVHHYWVILNLADLRSLFRSSDLLSITAFETSEVLQTEAWIMNRKTLCLDFCPLMHLHPLRRLTHRQHRRAKFSSAIFQFFTHLSLLPSSE